MTPPNPEPPTDFASAEKLFRNFVSAEGYPPIIRWVMIDDVVPGKGRHCWVRKDIRNRSVIEASGRYGVGLKKGLGIALTAFGKSERETFATIFIPEDETDAQYHLMGRGLKVSCVTTPIRVSNVRNPIRWFILRLLRRKAVKELRELGEL